MAKFASTTNREMMFTQEQTQQVIDNGNKLVDALEALIALGLQDMNDPQELLRKIPEDRKDEVIAVLKRINRFMI